MLEQLITLDQAQWFEVFRLAVLSQACVMFCLSELDWVAQVNTACSVLKSWKFHFPLPGRDKTQAPLFWVAVGHQTWVWPPGLVLPPGNKAWGEIRHIKWQLRSYCFHSKAFLRLPAVSQAVCFPPPASAGQMRDAGPACTPSHAFRDLPWVESSGWEASFCWWWWMMAKWRGVKACGKSLGLLGNEIHQSLLPLVTFRFQDLGMNGLVEKGYIRLDWNPLCLM